MKSQATKQIMDVLYVSEPTSRNFTQQFQFSNQLIKHQHQVEVSHLQQQDYHLQIKNHYAVQKDMKLFKVTEIMMENRVIRIIDTFECLQNPDFMHRKPEHVSQIHKTHKKPSTVKKYTIFKTKQEEMEMESNKMKDTKNVVKNIIRLFQCWLEENLPEYKEIYDDMLALIQRIKFNNNLIFKLVQKDSIRKAFIYFGLKDGKQFIDKSKIHDKNTHLEALLRYIQLFQQEEQRANSCAQVEKANSIQVAVRQQ